MPENDPFEYGSVWVRGDFHLHTKADKEFKYVGDENAFVGAYIEKLEETGVGLGVVTNHNKFDMGEFKALRKAARKRGIGLLPGVELSVNDGANGVHTLVVFSDDWLKGGNDYINQFLNVAFAGKTPDQYEQENGRSNDNLITTLNRLEEYNKDFFIIFAHVEAPSGLWNELDGGRMQELANNPLIQKYCLGFQKVRTHDKPDKKCRTKVQQWWGSNYPAELEGSDPKALDDVGRGRECFLQIGDFNFDAVRYALTDHPYRTSQNEAPEVSHSHVNAIRFEGGLFDGKRVTFSPHLNCLIGIQGSGKSSVLESLRYALNLEFGERAQDKEYKDGLIPHVLKSGGKIVVEVTDRHGTRYDVGRIYNHEPDVYVDGELQPGVSIRETVINRPLYFGQKDLAAAGKEFGHDLVEKLIGDGLNPYRETIEEKKVELKQAVEALSSLQSDADKLETFRSELRDVNFRLEQFEKHGVKTKLEKQVEFGKDLAFCETVDTAATEWKGSLERVVGDAEERFEEIESHESKYNKPLFEKYTDQIANLKNTMASAKAVIKSIGTVRTELGVLRGELETTKDGLKEEFAETERELVKALESNGVTSIQPDDYIKLTERNTELQNLVSEFEKKTEKYSAKSDALLRAIANLNEAWHAEFKFIEAELDKINSSQSSLKIDSEFKGNKSEFQKKMEDTFRGSNIRKESFSGLATDYIDFGEIYKDLANASKKARSKAETFSELFENNAFSLLSFQIPNRYEVTYNGKPLKSHSLGQRASAMMLFLLSQNDNDLLLIDQPEDDLDSQTVYEEVVKLLRIIKPRQQFIFATHNANFPVLGDAETVTACSADETAFNVVTGSVDSKECQNKIIRIMEGGPEAFERRKTIYQIWNPRERAN
ncbi:TrlF family AAA-like ATPase [Thioalkalivibrio sp. ALE28]|uniref:TrlF family AAA-like ATPase n=1 Tax=Thioalkalivibrio sp. ALE28 TaxID=1158179 RepID=UPI00039FB18F|nr:AAA family ATPase [Thioalkalivibrio sp. ALE28]